MKEMTKTVWKKYQTPLMVAAAVGFIVWFITSSPCH